MKPPRILLFVAALVTLVGISILDDGVSRAQSSQPDASGRASLQTGFAAKRPVFAGACEQACPWGEIADFVQESMARAGYDVIICRNCNRDQGPRIVSERAYPPPLRSGELDSASSRVNAPVDFGVTDASMLAWAYEGKTIFAHTGPYKNLRLIAKIEDPTYFMIAVKRGSAILDLAQIRAQRLPVKILSDGQPTTQAALAAEGLTPAALASWGGSFVNPMQVRDGGDFDVLVGSIASPANNPESAYWTTLTQKFDLTFLDVPQPVADLLVRDFGMQRVVARWGLLRGVDRRIATVGRSGEAVFTRDDAPDGAIYDVAKAIDEHRGALKWFVRPYSYDPRTVTQDGDIPLHPGAERYYREAGYLK